MEITARSKNIQKMLKETLFSIPNFQRPYSWGEEQLNEFWNDVLNVDNEDYFLGTIVTFVSEKRDLFRDTQAVIDGQQRLTTITILLSALRDAFLGQLRSTEDEEPRKLAETQAESTSGYILAYDDDKKEYPVVARDEHAFYNVIQKDNDLGSKGDDSGSWKKSQDAYDFFTRKIADAMDNVGDSVGRIAHIRNLLLRCQIIVVSVDSEEDAFYIFETINARGMDLKAADLIKNLMVRNGGVTEQERRSVGKRWQDLIDAIRQTDSEDDYTDKFLWQSWASRRPAVKEEELYKAIRQNLLGGVKAGNDEAVNSYVDYLEEIETDSETYRHLEGRSSEFPKPKKKGRKSALSIPEVQRSIEALGIFNVSVSNSAVMAIVRKYDITGLVTQSQLKRVLSAIESFHFQYTMLAGAGSTGGTRGRYNRFAVELEQAASKSEVASAIQTLIDGLSSSLPSADECKQTFASIFYAPNIKIAKKYKKLSNSDFVTYVLLRLSGHYNDLGDPQKKEAWTIEHIVPQATLGGEGTIDDAVFSVGNLTLLSDAANSRIGDGNFGLKSQTLETGARPYDTALAEWSANYSQDDGFEVSSDDIEERAWDLADAALDNVWVVV